MLKQKTNQRRIFLRQLSEELCIPLIEDRATNNQVTRNFATRVAIENMIGKPIADLASNVPTPSTSQQVLDITGRKVVVGSCHICYKGKYKKLRKTRKSCMECKKPVCDEHAKTITKCGECL